MVQKYTLLILILWFVGFNASTSELIPCQEMKFGSQDAICIYKANDFQFHTESSGNITVVTPDKIRGLAKVNLPKNYYIEDIVHETYKDKIYFVFGISDGDYAGSLIAEFDISKLKFIWQTQTGGFNADLPLVEEKAVYVASIGTVIKIDRTTGNIIWRHDGLYESDSQAYNSFIKPRREGESIIFEEDKTSIAKYYGIRKVIVDDKSGRLISK